MPIRQIAAAMAVGLALLTAIAAGQGPQGGSPSAVPQAQPAVSPSRLQPQPAPRADVEGAVVSIDFKGGTLGDLVKTLQGQVKEPVNIALQGDAAGIPVEPMVLRNVTVYSALQAAIGSRVNTLLFEPDGTSKQIFLGQLPASGEAAPVFVVTRRETESRQVGREPIVQVFSIQRLVSGAGAMASDVLLTAIDTGLGLQVHPNRPRPEIKLHKDSGLLLVRGDPGDVGLIDQIVSRLQKDHDRQLVDEARRKAFEIDRAARRKKAESNVRAADENIATAREAIKSRDEAIKQGAPGISDAERRQMDRQMASFLEYREAAQADLDRIKAETDAGLSLDGSSTDAAGLDAGVLSGSGVREERIRALEARITALEAELAASKAQGGRQRSR